jgi:hypothetical protein
MNALLFFGSALPSFQPDNLLGKMLTLSRSETRQTEASTMRGFMLKKSASSSAKTGSRDPSPKPVPAIDSPNLGNHKGPGTWKLFRKPGFRDCIPGSTLTKVSNPDYVNSCKDGRQVITGTRRSDTLLKRIKSLQFKNKLAPSADPGFS